MAALQCVSFGGGTAEPTGTSTANRWLPGPVRALSFMAALQCVVWRRYSRADRHQHCQPLAAGTRQGRVSFMAALQCVSFGGGTAEPTGTSTADRWLPGPLRAECHLWRHYSVSVLEVVQQSRQAPAGTRQGSVIYGGTTLSVSVLEAVQQSRQAPALPTAGCRHPSGPCHLWRHYSVSVLEAEQVRVVAVWGWRFAFLVVFVGLKRHGSRAVGASVGDA
jgi:hypothetical protein